MNGSFADVEGPQSIYDEVFICGPTAGPIVLPPRAVIDGVRVCPAPGAVRLPALGSRMASSNFPTICAGGAVGARRVIGLVSFGESSFTSVVVVVVVALLLVLVRPLPIPVL